MASINRRLFLAQAAAGLCAAGFRTSRAQTVKRPNILFAIADDWSWPHASAHGAPQIQTPVFDRVAREGALYNNAFTCAPQCSPNRAATLTGRYIWEIAEAGTHGSLFPNRFAVYTDLLEENGYHVGYTSKGWAPGDWEAGGWKRNPAGKEYNRERLRPPQRGINSCDYAENFSDFLEDRDSGQPFCFWFGCKEPHRGYEAGSWKEYGKDPDAVVVPPFLPDTPEVREDLLDYFVEVEHFDTQLGAMLAKLEVMGELDNTLVVVTSDNGMPFPRAKANCYEYGVHMPLAIRWPGHTKAGDTRDELVSFIDFAPTFLAAAGVTAPPEMHGRDLFGDTPPRDHVLFGRERHTHARRDNVGYPIRAIRTAEYLYLWNVKPDRWPAGDPEGYHDIDGSPTKTFMQEHAKEYPALWEAAVGKRPEVELFDIQKDPACMHNVAEEKADTCKNLGERLRTLLHAQGDPRMHGQGDVFESYPRFSSMRPELGGFAEQGAYNPKFQE
ncbi:sulfatase [Roseovarius pacificus]|uniref:sulfatase family protein n=1 Tax=Roseovarius pacificus TaxID=337701 RepID=UPI002A1899F3|nr:sulfatase [Roseovarius pacificus]